MLARRLSPSVLRPAAALIALLTLLLPSLAGAQTPDRAPDRVIEGRITHADHQRYVRAPFDLPAGTDRLVVAFDHDGREARTVIDLGLEDTRGFRGASGGNKSSFTVARADATPSYLAGPLDPGGWALALAVPNIRAGVTTRWTARLWFLKGAEAQVLPSPTRGRGRGWFAGDLHMHSAHSDGSCDSQTGARIPCPLMRTLDAAAARRLDFIAVTEHNTASHNAVLREAAPAYDRMLLIPGQEITTFHGHFGVLGIAEPVDFRIAPGIDNGFDAIADRVHALGGLVSVNHPGLPSGEICMGCGWTMPGADLSKVDAVEFVNGSSVDAAGGDPERPGSGIPFWLSRLAAGQRIAGLGGSDNHDPARTGLGAIGSPTTVVEAEDLTQPAILAGLRAGRSYTRIADDPSLHCDFTVVAGARSARMGGTLAVGTNAPLALTPDVRGPASMVVELWDGGQRLRTLAGPATIRLSRGRHALHLRLRGADGALLAIGNAVLVDAG